MNKNEALKRKLELASSEELLVILLKDTESKFNKVIKLWQENNLEGNAVIGRLCDNIFELQSTINTENNDSDISKALQNIKDLYGYINDELFAATPKMDATRVVNAREIFLELKEIFENDIKTLNNQD